MFLNDGSNFFVLSLPSSSRTPSAMSLGQKEIIILYYSLVLLYISQSFVYCLCLVLASSTKRTLLMSLNMRFINHTFIIISSSNNILII